MLVDDCGSKVRTGLVKTSTGNGLGIYTSGGQSELRWWTIDGKL